MNVRTFAVLSVSAAMFSFLYAYPHYGTPDNQHAWRLLHGKPFIYRALLITPLSFVDDAHKYTVAVLVEVMSGVCMLLSWWYLASVFMPITPKVELFLILAFGLFTILFFHQAQLYDMLSATLFSLCLAFMQRGKYIAYLITFTLASLNRETAILLLPISALWLWRNK